MWKSSLVSLLERKTKITVNIFSSPPTEDSTSCSRWYVRRVRRVWWDSSNSIIIEGWSMEDGPTPPQSRIWNSVGEMNFCSDSAANIIPLSEMNVLSVIVTFTCFEVEETFTGNSRLDRKKFSGLS